MGCMDPNEIAESAAAAAWWSAIGTLATAALTLGLLVGAWFAWRTAKQTLKQAKETHLQLQKDSLEQTRPYVYVHLVPGLAGLATWDLLITNTGRSTARNLRIECDAWPDKDDIVTGPLRTLFSTARSLPPGATIRSFWKLGLSESGATWDDGTSNPVGITAAASLTLRYTSDDPSRPNYQDEYALDATTIGQTPAAYCGPDPKPGLTPAERDLHNMLAAIASNVGELRR